jgi:hypothetical protein
MHLHRGCTRAVSAKGGRIGQPGRLYDELRKLETVGIERVNSES